MDPATGLLAAAAIAQFGITAPALSASGAPTPYGVLGCLQRARNVLYANGGTNLQERGNTLFAVVASDTTAMAWCRVDHVIVVGAGPHATQVSDMLKVGF